VIEDDARSNGPRNGADDEGRVEVKSLCKCRVTVDGVTPIRLIMNDQAVERALRQGYRILDTTIRGWGGFNSLIEIPSQKVPGVWSSYLARFDPESIDVAAHPETVIGRQLDEARSDELLSWRRAKPVTDQSGTIVALDIRGHRSSPFRPSS